MRNTYTDSSGVKHVTLYISFEPNTIPHSLFWGLPLYSMYKFV